MYSFEYHKPSSLSEAASLLTSHPTTARGTGTERPATPEKIWRAVHPSPLAQAAEEDQGKAPMYSFEYHKPPPPSEAASLLTSHEDAKLLAGGQTYIPTLKQ